MTTRPQQELPKGLPILIIVGVVLFILFFKTIVKIEAGQGGVLYKPLSEGVVLDEPALIEGFHIIAPWNDVQKFDLRQQEYFDQMKILSSNGLDIQLDASIWYQPDEKKLALLYKTKGVNYLEKLVRPALRSATREVVGRYTPEEIYSSKRGVIQKEILQETVLILKDEYVQINKILVRDVTLPTTIKDAIELKLKQEQEAKAYEFRLVKASKEAEKVRIEAQGKADANRILSASLTDKILKDKGIEATLQLAESPNTKVVIVGGKDGMPLILGNN